MKLLASDNRHRHFDIRDITVLLQNADSATIDIVRQRPGLITDRGRDLAAEFDMLLKNSGWPDDMDSSEFDG